MEKILKIISKTLSTVLIIIVVLLAVLLIGVRLFGLTPYTVLSGSMEPTYHVGSIVYVEKVDVTTLKVGDPITFRLTGDVIATHRIIEIHGAGTSDLGFRTQGDANETEDGITPAAAVIGRVVFNVPYLGYVSNFVQNPMGIICVVGTSAVVLIISNTIDFIFSKKKESEPEADSEENNV
jgi:signal peptidase